MEQGNKLFENTLPPKVWHKIGFLTVFEVRTEYKKKENVTDTEIIQ